MKYAGPFRGRPAPGAPHHPGWGGAAGRQAPRPRPRRCDGRRCPPSEGTRTVGDPSETIPRGGCCPLARPPPSGWAPSSKGRQVRECDVARVGRGPGVHLVQVLVHELRQVAAQHPRLQGAPSSYNSLPPLPSPPTAARWGRDNSAVRALRFPGANRDRQILWRWGFFFPLFTGQPLPGEISGTPCTDPATVETCSPICHHMSQRNGARPVTRMWSEGGQERLEAADFE